MEGANHIPGMGGGCLNGTRISVLREIENWVTGSCQPPIYLLYGFLGTGKTAIARTIVETMHKTGRPVASFFCSREKRGLAHYPSIFPTLARELADKNSSFRSELFANLGSPKISALKEQVKKLIVTPIIQSGLKGTVIVIDGLDQCFTNQSTFFLFLETLIECEPQTKLVKYFITSRANPYASNHPAYAPKGIVMSALHEVVSDEVGEDIRLFFKNEFSALIRSARLASRRDGGSISDGEDLPVSDGKDSPVSDGKDSLVSDGEDSPVSDGEDSPVSDGEDWPAAGDLNKLCECAAGLFAYAEAIVQFIGTSDSESPVQQLDKILYSTEGEESVCASGIDPLYKGILQEAFGGDPGDEKAKRELYSVLSAIVLAPNPISPPAIAMLSGRQDVHVGFIPLSIRGLFPIVWKDRATPVCGPFHKSFLAFLTDPNRRAGEFYVNLPACHEDFLVACLTRMNEKLRGNMRKHQGAVGDEQYGIDGALEYACTSWHEHLAATAPAGNTARITDHLHPFLQKKFKFWREALGVLDATSVEKDALTKLEKWSQVRSVSPSHRSIPGIHNG